MLALSIGVQAAQERDRGSEVQNRGFDVDVHSRRMREEENASTPFLAFESRLHPPL